MVHSTTTGVLAAAGFTDNTSIIDSVVQAALSSAERDIHRILEVTGYTLSASAPVPLLGTIARILGAGRLQTSEYESGAYGTNKDGQASKKDTRAMLDRTPTGSRKTGR